jgi:hypothetical protein
MFRTYKNHVVNYGPFIRDGAPAGNSALWSVCCVMSLIMATTPTVHETVFCCRFHPMRTSASLPPKAGASWGVDSHRAGTTVRPVAHHALSRMDLVCDRMCAPGHYIYVESSAALVAVCNGSLAVILGSPCLALPGYGGCRFARWGTSCHHSDVTMRNSRVRVIDTNSAPEQRSNTFPIRNESIERSNHSSGPAPLSCKSLVTHFGWPLKTKELPLAGFITAGPSQIPPNSTAD